MEVDSKRLSEILQEKPPSSVSNNSGGGDDIFKSIEKINKLLENKTVQGMLNKIIDITNQKKQPPQQQPQQQAQQQPQQNENVLNSQPQGQPTEQKAEEIFTQFERLIQAVIMEDEKNEKTTTPEELKQYLQSYKGSIILGLQEILK